MHPSLGPRLPVILRMMTAVCAFGALECSVLAAGVSAQENPADQGSLKTGTTEGKSSPRFLVIRADRQQFQADRGRWVASGSVEARFGGWLLLADRVEILESTRTVYATGRLRLYKGDQMLQASRLRYSELEGSGELEDVYGVIDQDKTEQELKALARADAKTQTEASTPTLVPSEFACPEVVSQEGARPVLQLLPPRWEALPTMPAPPGCTVAETPPQQRVKDVRYQQSLETAIKLDLVAVIDTDDQEGRGGPGTAGIYRRPRPSKGRLNRLRFQASALRVQGNRWSAEQVAFSNDPFTPARSWTIGQQVEARVEDDGVTRIQAKSTRILLSNRLAVRGVTNAVIGEETLQLSLDTDQRDRDGIYLGYNLPIVRLGEKGTLELQPQFMVQRAIEGRTKSYTAPGKSLAGPRVSQSLRAGDLFGLEADLDAPLGDFRLQADSSLSSLNPDNIKAANRSRARFGLPLSLPGHSTARAQVFGSYRERVYNGSLGLQTVVYSYGGQMAGSIQANPDPEDPGEDERRLPHFGPVSVDWRALSGNYQANLYRSNRLDTQWRSWMNASVNSSLRLWEAELDPQRGDQEALRYSPVAIRPGLALNFGLAGATGFYEDGANQNTLTLYGGPSITLGRFRDPWFDYTRVDLLVGGTFRDGASPFGFDRAVDLATVSFRATQQLYGPLVLQAGATVNADGNSRFYGDVSYSYLELKLQQRSYELGVYYSPYDGIGGIRIRLNDFNFTGGGSPFVPRKAAASSGAETAEVRE